LARGCFVVSSGTITDEMIMNILKINILQKKKEDFMIDRE